MLTTLRQRNFALLWLGGLISQTGDWLLQIGLPFYVYVLTGSALATSIMLIVSFVPNFLLGSIAGVLVDRWDRRRILLLANFLMAIGLLPLLLVHDQSSLWIMYIVLFFEAIVAQFIMPAENALLPLLVSDDQLISANSLNSIGNNVSRLAGGALGGILLGLLGLQSTVLLDLFSFLFVVVMIWFIKMPAPNQVAQATALSDSASADNSSSLLSIIGRFAREWSEGLQLIAQQTPLLILFIMFAATRLGEGVFGVLLAPFVKQVLRADVIVYGALLSVQAVGGLLGGLLIGQFGKRQKPVRLLWIGACLFGIIDLLIIDLPLLIPNIWLVGLLFILVGIPGVAAVIGQQTLFQRLVDDRFRGRVFGAMLSVGSLMTLLGMILAGALGDRVGPVLLLNIQGGVYFLSGLLILVTLGRTRHKAIVEDEPVAHGEVSA